jgi:hypothetical protein
MLDFAFGFWKTKLKRKIVNLKASFPTAKWMTVLQIWGSLKVTSFVGGARYSKLENWRNPEPRIRDSVWPRDSARIRSKGRVRFSLELAYFKGLGWVSLRWSQLENRRNPEQGKLPWNLDTHEDRTHNGVDIVVLMSSALNTRPPSCLWRCKKKDANKREPKTHVLK